MNVDPSFLLDPQRAEYLCELRQARDAERALRQRITRRSAAVSVGVAIGLFATLLVGSVTVGGVLGAVAFEYQLFWWASAAGATVLVGAITATVLRSVSHQSLLATRARTAWAAARFDRYERELIGTASAVNADNAESLSEPRRTGT